MKKYKNELFVNDYSFSIDLKLLTTIEQCEKNMIEYVCA